ncbi:hypothetical protein D046_8191 [Vibrio parahaemolyticus V-223/04]|nr:hypothetical protein D034_1242 [Vibrio parahaemolyticus Peru-288]EVU10485.1 hypothetical protein D046_8191 [Vibrio parahaemolyticus V-223/04]
MHIDKSTPKAHKNNNLRVYAFGHNLLHPFNYEVNATYHVI